MAEKALDIVLLLALPASGKSEVRRYLKSVTPAQCRADFHMGETVQLDDFPYVHLMRRIDDELEAVEAPRVFFQAGDRPFQNPLDWGTLIELVNEDYADLVARKVAKPASAAALLFDRLDAASAAVGAPRRLASLPETTRSVVAEKLEREARELLDEKHAGYPDSLEGKTMVIEFARGGPDGSTCPLNPPFGYEYSLGRLAPEILEKASILYVWVTPEESRRKNFARTDPNDPGSILHHGVPLSVMLGDYGCDDLAYLESVSERPGTVTVKVGGRSFHLPVGRFDNRIDKTSFLRNERADWTSDEVAGVHAGLKGALDHIAASR